MEEGKMNIDFNNLEKKAKMSALDEPSKGTS
jgi:hypothetical protein